MASKRMFSLNVVDTDKFLEMPISARLLYYELGMRADDDGFVDTWKKILMFTGLKEDDMKILIAKQFIIPFESGVIVIKHWRLNNYLQKDRTKPTIYQEELRQLNINESNEYMIDDGTSIEQKKSKPLDNARIKRIEAKKESELPYSFEYKIRNAFYGERCPICNVVMDNTYDKNIPTIQHNIPISKGGKHEIDNISVVCRSCNCSIKNNEITPPYNTEKVKEIWNVYKNDEECIHSIDKNSIDLDKNSIEEKEIIKEKEKKVKHKYGEYQNVLLTDKELQSLKSDYDNYDELIKYLDEWIEMKGYKAKSHYLCIKKWVVKAVKENNKKKTEIDWSREDE